jgi:hypothetical protein
MTKALVSKRRSPFPTCRTAENGLQLPSFGGEYRAAPYIAAYVDEEGNLAPIEIVWGIGNEVKLTGKVKHTFRVEYLQHGRSDNSKILTQQTDGLTVRFSLGTNFIGGTFHATIEAPWILNSTGQTGIAEGAVYADIGGNNPSHERLRQEIPDLTLQVIAFKESRFRQFGPDHSPIFNEPNGFGLMQLDPPPDPFTIWNWKRNLKAAKSLFGQKVKAAKSYENKIRKQYKDARPLTPEEVLLEAYHRYNGGSHWSWDTALKSWVASPGNGYADDCLRIQRLVEAGRPPKDW